MSNGPSRGTISKINGLEELSRTLATRRDGNSLTKVVHCHGVFDLLHIGHIRHFEQAKQSGDILVVTITPDHFVNKGPHRPAFSAELRAEAIAALDCVDYVAINQWPTAVPTIELLKPNIYAKGADYSDPDNDVTGKIVDEAAAVKSVGGEIVFTDDIAFSSSNLINKYLPVFSEEVTEYLTEFSKRYFVDDVATFLDRAHSLRVLVVGETIIDEYQYVEQIGKSAKEPTLAVSYQSTEKFAGGILAVANHLAGFCDNVSVLTCLGAEDSQEDFLRQHLHSNVEPLFLYQERSPTIVKRRFVESYLSQKLFEVYVMNDQGLSEAETGIFCDKLDRILDDYDLVVIADYGDVRLVDL